MQIGLVCELVGVAKVIINVFSFDKERNVLLVGSLGPPHPHARHCLITTVVKDLEHLSTEELGDHFVVVATSDGELEDLPRVLIAPGPAHAFEPRVQRPVVVLDVEVLFRLELKRFVAGHVADASPTANGLLSRRRSITNENLHMHHVVFLNMHRLVVVRAVKYQVPRPELLLFQGDRQCIKLIGLISSTQCEAKFYPQVADGARN